VIHEARGHAQQNRFAQGALEEPSRAPRGSAVNNRLANDVDAHRPPVNVAKRNVSDQVKDQARHGQVKHKTVDRLCGTHVKEPQVAHAVTDHQRHKNRQDRIREVG
jgi:hypothetical protein